MGHLHQHSVTQILDIAGVLPHKVVYPCLILRLGGKEVLNHDVEGRKILPGGGPESSIEEGR